VVNVEVLATDELGDRSYVAHDWQAAVVIDPQRDIDRVQSVLTELGLRCTLVLETHIHNDYVSGGLELAARTGAAYVVAGTEEVAFDRRAVSDGDELAAGRMTVKVVATPGHTEGHLSYIVSDQEGSQVVFSGGSLLFGSVGRTDLVDPDRIHELTRAQYRSARRLVALVPDDAALYPTHGFGSFCSTGAAVGDSSSTIGLERQRNDALVTDDEDDFVGRLVAGLTTYPSYYAHMAPLNRAGPARVDLSLPRATDPEELARRISAGEWVVDLRSQTAYAAEHLAGTIGISLAQHFSLYLGWLLPWGTPLTLLGEDPKQISDARRQLVRLGIDDLAGAAVGTPSVVAPNIERRTYRVTDFADLGRHPEAVVLDVRRDDERGESHIAGSVHVPLHLLLERIDTLPCDTLWVHCVSGYRASIAASLLDRAGRRVVLVDDDFANARRLADHDTGG
jgi:glyoxylase-like metal-dependent hydrolase (beta-lactamase superfamily II)/rhodanese-related sulfurtransferase